MLSYSALLFVCFQVNTGVLCCLDYVEDIYIRVLCPRFNPQPKSYCIYHILIKYMQ